MEIRRIKTGIDGLDKLTGGGFPEGYCILVSGMPGTGKTVFGIQYLCNGAKEGEKGLYISFTPKIDDVIKQAEIFGLDIQGLMDKDLVKAIRYDMKETDINKVILEIKEGDYDRVVVDSITAMLMHPMAWKSLDLLYTLQGDVDKLIPSPRDVIISSRIILNEFIGQLKELNCTSVITSEITQGSEGLSRDTVSEFIADGVITLHFIRSLMERTESSRILVIRKMRATKHSEDVHPIEFVEGSGIKVLPS